MRRALVTLGVAGLAALGVAGTAPAHGSDVQHLLGWDRR